ncbi:MAG TPA: SRPBCC domain-containing protein [Candidatus Thermoplasmatota archaeon]|nr:SRPBCC domain-containing protein [Candidatus Thermoplasmatota archaeon]
MAQVQKTIEVAATPEEVWDALVNPKKLSAWLECEAGFRRHGTAVHAGDSFRLDWGEEWVATGEVVDAKPGARLVTTWEWEGDDEETEVVYELAKTPKGTRLSLTHRGFEDEETAEEHGDNWEAYLANLATVAGARR